MPSVCVATCGDGITVGAETCDDGNTASGDGCSATCELEPGYACTGAPSVCAAICGDGVDRAAPRPATTATWLAGDGCTAPARSSRAGTCAGAPERLRDDLRRRHRGRRRDLRRRQPRGRRRLQRTCTVEPGCVLQRHRRACARPAAATASCAGAEECDDGNTPAGDGCSAACTVEPAGSSCSSDTNGCTDDVCNGGGTCTHAFNTAPCSDGSACTVSDVCAAGACTPGSPLACNDGNVCTNDSCNPASGCVTTLNTAACDDSNACTIGDFCSAGICEPGGPLGCDDADSCSVDSCQPASGCVHVNDPILCAIPTESVQPIVECVVENGPGDFTAHFGYLNANSAPVSIPVGANNSLAPAPIDRGQTTTFAPGRSPFFPATAFQVDFDGSSLTWTLRSPNGTTLSTMASGSSGRCPAPPTLLRQYSICYGTADFTGNPPKSLPLQAIEDTFEARTFDLRNSRSLCAPVQVTYAGELHLVVDPATHLLGRNLSADADETGPVEIEGRRSGE